MTCCSAFILVFVSLGCCRTPPFFLRHLAPRLLLLRFLHCVSWCPCPRLPRLVAWLGLSLVSAVIIARLCPRPSPSERRSFVRSSIALLACRSYVWSSMWCRPSGRSCLVPLCCFRVRLCPTMPSCCLPHLRLLTSSFGFLRSWLPADASGVLFCPWLFFTILSLLPTLVLTHCRRTDVHYGFRH